MLLEIACFNLESCRLAQAAGADRIELCENYAAGGITPSEQLIAEARSQLSIPLHVIIRPRDGSFVFSDEEHEAMKASIAYCKEKKVDGVVIGVLNPNATVNVKACEELIHLARPMSVTFHRAIDDCNNLTGEIERLAALGVQRVLSSGGKSNVIEGLEALRELCSRFKNKIIIMPGGGVRSGSIEKLLVTGAHEFHSAALTDNSGIADAEEIRRLKRLIPA
ncbi:MAG: copper homeostasis protein CutC [Bacteroidia bacterium]